MFVIFRTGRKEIFKKDPTEMQLEIKQNIYDMGVENSVNSTDC